MNRAGDQNRPAWVFFDVGNVLLNDDLALAETYKTLHTAIRHERPEFRFLDLMAKREELITLKGDGQPHATIGREFLGEGGWMALRAQILTKLNENYERYHIPVSGANRVMKHLAAGYRIGIAANQVRACREALDKFGLLQYTSLVWLSEDRGVHKPDPEFYAGFLKEAGCPPEQAVMIGDRLDYDIRPAKAIGMRTVLARFRFNVPVEPDEPYVKMYVNSLRRARVSYARPAGPEETPDHTISSFARLPRLLAGM